jgi:hypothetical protein
VIRRVPRVFAAVVADWWTFLLSPWRHQLGRDEFDVDVLGHLSRLETRVDKLERKRGGKP